MIYKERERLKKEVFDLYVFEATKKYDTTQKMLELYIKVCEFSLRVGEVNAWAISFPRFRSYLSGEKITFGRDARALFARFVDAGLC